MDIENGPINGQKKTRKKKKIKKWFNTRKIVSTLSGTIIRKHLVVWTTIHSFFQILVIAFFFTFPSVSFISFGPSHKLLVAGIPIDTWSKYFVLLTYVTIAKIIRTATEDTIMPFMQNHCYDTNIKIIYNYGKKEIIGLEFINSVAFKFGHIFDLMVTISQIDLAVYELVVGEIVGSIILTFYLREKEFLNSSDEKTLVDNNNEEDIETNIKYKEQH